MSLCSKGHSDAEKANLCGLIRGVFLEEGELPSELISQSPPQYQLTSQLAQMRLQCAPLKDTLCARMLSLFSRV